MSVLSQRVPSVRQLPRAPRKWAQTHASPPPTVHLLQEHYRWVTPPMAPSRDCRRFCIWPCAPSLGWQLQDLICCSMRSLFLCHSSSSISFSSLWIPCSVWGHRNDSLSFLGRTRAAHVSWHQTCQDVAVLPSVHRGRK